MMTNRQCTHTVLMIRPMRFGFNPETASSNRFQQPAADDSAANARLEFDHAVRILKGAGINVIQADDSDFPLPDSVFPNNWFSTHHDGKVILYPMLAPSRRMERRSDIIDKIIPENGFQVNSVTDLSRYEQYGQYLEGTGSMVMDHANKIIYACRSSRTHEAPLQEAASLLGYALQVFDASVDGHEIYHTNVMLAIGKEHAVLCEEAVDPADRNRIKKAIESTHRLIPVSIHQMKSMAGNMLMLVSKNETCYTVMSQQAMQSLSNRQLNELSECSEILPIPVGEIERAGGGSIRCMMAEIFLPPQ